eukprot:gnl/TRDRNA2_/TRDRNA2_83200_c0_seq1.p1 gnl/TRDRNA2_/TRDRNA2_83200_c0~~gnl/TRDRNA2_/TRDRNA2_83200_c0_seq1.p1  ORF type:complete len:180 (-),score=28.16 gnl/TRDRNA2_/TRDRNA2_83200_c0_seq1:133-612(-)
MEDDEEASQEARYTKPSVSANKFPRACYDRQVKDRKRRSETLRRKNRPAPRTEGVLWKEIDEDDILVPTDEGLRRQLSLTSATAVIGDSYFSAHVETMDLHAAEFERELTISSVRPITAKPTLFTLFDSLLEQCGADHSRGHDDPLEDRRAFPARYGGA